MATKAKINKCDCIKLNSFCTAKKAFTDPTGQKDNLLNKINYLQVMSPVRVTIQINTELVYLNIKHTHRNNVI